MAGRSALGLGIHAEAVRGQALRGSSRAGTERQCAGRHWTPNGSSVWTGKLVSAAKHRSWPCQPIRKNTGNSATPLALPNTVSCSAQNSRHPGPGRGSMPRRKPPAGHTAPFNRSTIQPVNATMQRALQKGDNLRLDTALPARCIAGDMRIGKTENLRLVAVVMATAAAMVMGTA